MGPLDRGAVGRRRARPRRAPADTTDWRRIVLAGAVVGGAGTPAAAMVLPLALTASSRRRDGISPSGAAAALRPAVAMHLLFGLADGRAGDAGPAARWPPAASPVVVGAALDGRAGTGMVVWRRIAVLRALALGSAFHASHVRCASRPVLSTGAGCNGSAGTPAWLLPRHSIVAVAPGRSLTDWPAERVGAVAPRPLSGLIPVALTLGTLPTRWWPASTGRWRARSRSLG